jgi:hypothetical protein
MNHDTYTDLRIEAKNGLYIAHFLPGRMDGWGLGDINRLTNPTETEQREFAQAIVDSIEPVSEGELAYSDCTDGRLREDLADGQPVPNREKLVGTDTMTAFHMAEALGGRFYQDPDAPLEVRLEELVDFLISKGLKPGTHFACGGAGSYLTIVQNAIEFATVPGYLKRQELLIPREAYKAGLRPQIIQGYRDRLASKLYAGWSDQKIIDVIEKKVGDHAIAHVRDDGRGVHGHVEGMIVRLNTPGATVNVNSLAERTDGKQAFTINDNRLAELAELFGRGHDDDYKIAYMAGEDFTDAAHGTLATNLRTLVIKQAA